MEPLTEEIKSQLRQIRDGGQFNMLDYNGIHRYANDQEFYGLVVWMADHGIDGWLNALEEAFKEE